MKKLNFIESLSLLMLFWFVPAATSLALEISTFPGVPIVGDIVLSPAKVELNLEPGAKSIRYLDITNRMGSDAVFSFSVEDFAPSGDSHEGVVLGKTVDGLDSSLKRYMSVNVKPFLLSHGQRARVPIEISVPKKVASQGLYAVVLVSSSPLKNESGSTKIITRLGSMFFVKVNGYQKELGIFESVSFHGNNIEIVFKNSGDIYLNPYGIINIYDYYSKKLVRKIDIDPWFVLPRSSRSRTIVADNLANGKYTAEIILNRGYDNMLDSRDLSFEINSSAEKRSYQPLVYVFIAVIILFLYKYLFYAK